MLDWRTLEEIQFCQPWAHPLIALTRGVIWRGSMEVSPPEKNLSIGKRELDSRAESVYSCSSALPWKKGLLPWDTPAELSHPAQAGLQTDLC